MRLKRVGENFEQAWDPMSGGEHAVDRGRVEVAASGTVCTCFLCNWGTSFCSSSSTFVDLPVGRICSVVV